MRPAGSAKRRVGSFYSRVPGLITVSAACVGVGLKHRCTVARLSNSPRRGTPVRGVACIPTLGQTAFDAISYFAPPNHRLVGIFSILPDERSMMKNAINRKTLFCVVRSDAICSCGFSDILLKDCPVTPLSDLLPPLVGAAALVVPGVSQQAIARLYGRRRRSRQRTDSTKQETVTFAEFEFRRFEGGICYR